MGEAYLPLTFMLFGSLGQRINDIKGERTVRRKERNILFVGNIGST